jgi:hypothetical protein
VNETRSACFARFAARCEEQLTLWRQYEQQKDVAKVFTSIFIMVGIGILGALVGAVGETLMEWVHNILGGVEYGRILALLSCIFAPAISLVFVINLASSHVLSGAIHNDTDHSLKVSGLPNTVSAIWTAGTQWIQPRMQLPLSLRQSHLLQRRSLTCSAMQ